MNKKHFKVKFYLFYILLFYSLINIVKKGNDGILAILTWVKYIGEGFPGVNIFDFKKSFEDGLVFNAIICKHNPHLIDFATLNSVIYYYYYYYYYCYYYYDNNYNYYSKLLFNLFNHFQII